MEFSVHLLHLKVRTLHYPHLQWGAADLHSGCGKSADLLHGIQGFWQIGLKHDSAGVGLEALVGEHAPKDIDGHIEVFEFLHVEVDKGWRVSRRGLLVERQESLDDSADRLVIRPHRELARKRRNLDRHVVHIISSNECAYPRETPIGLAVPQHRFTQKIDVELIALLL